LDAPEDKIKASFRKLALEYHPDRNPSPDAKLKLQRIYDAYEKINTPGKRREFATEPDMTMFRARTGATGTRTVPIRNLSKKHRMWSALLGLGGLALTACSGAAVSSMWSNRNTGITVEEMAATAKQHHEGQKNKPKKPPRRGHLVRQHQHSTDGQRHMKQR
jgi:DnaJ-class molecular chaperone